MTLHREWEKESGKNMEKERSENAKVGQKYLHRGTGNPGLNPGSVAFITEELSAYRGVSHSELQFAHV